MKAIWDGSISFGLVNIPVQVFPAAQDHEIHFHFLHERDSGRIHNQRICEVCGEEVAYDEIVKGYEYEKDEFVTLTNEDFEKVNLESAKSIAILDFVQESEIDPMFFDKPYYLIPEKKGEQAYVLLREALKASGKVGIAKLVFRTREKLAAIHARENALMLDLLHYASEVQESRELKFPQAKSALNKRELQIADQLIDQMTVPFDPEKYVDTYEENLRKLVDKKLKGQLPKAKPKKKASTNVIDIMSKLKASLKQEQSRKRSA